jgi:hypothetical protein
MRPRSATSVPSTAHDSLSMMQSLPHLLLGAYKCFITNAIWEACDADYQDCCSRCTLSAD